MKVTSLPMPSVPLLRQPPELALATVRKGGVTPCICPINQNFFAEPGHELRSQAVLYCEYPCSMKLTGATECTAATTCPIATKYPRLAEAEQTLTTMQTRWGSLCEEHLLAS